MARQIINVGTAPNDGTGDTLKTSFTKCNANFLELYSAGSSSITISDTPPGSPTNGSLWWESDTGTLWISYNDGTSTQWVAAAGGSVVGGLASVKTVSFTASGTWTKQANLIGVEVEVWGGASGAALAANGYGGTAGGYARKWYAAAGLGPTITIIIGAGGAESGSSPGTGGTTTFAATSAVSASGGTYAGAAGSGSGGDINLTGQKGNTGISTMWGGGGNAPFMSGAGVVGANAQTAIANTGCGSSTGSGNPGASGYCLVKEYYSA